ncbi:MAG: DUF4920 domain-containing protein [Acidobacteria bacterium]|nr:DUF4920 domain-containing protein [Acidobacteriota bacterium]
MKFATILLTISSLFAWAGSPLGKPLTLKQQTSINDLKAKPADYVGKTVQVKGTVSEVCEKMGCWMIILDSKTKAAVRIKVKDGEIVFPKDSIGKTAVAEGKFAKIEMTKDQAIAQAKHEAEENKKPFDASKITGPTTTYQIQGTGAVIE